MEEAVEYQRNRLHDLTTITKRSFFIYVSTNTQYQIKNSLK